MLPFIINTFARFLATIVATCTKGALPCRKETKKSLNGFVSEIATMARSTKNLAGHRFLFKNCLPHIFYTYFLRCIPTKCTDHVILKFIF